MTDATILIPTFRHAETVPFAVRSALDQEEVEVEVFVVGDGVEDDTRAALQPLLGDSRVRFFDFPKGARHGEVHRHTALQEASGRIVCYLSDDDLLVPGHVAVMGRLLQDADFAHGPSASLGPTGRLHYFPFDIGRPEFAEIARSRNRSIGLTGAAHTLEAYRRLPHGWRTTPPGTLTDHYMWLQWLDLPGFRGAAGRRLTHLGFPDPSWGKLEPSERRLAVSEWFRRSREPGFGEQLDEMLQNAVRRAGEDSYIRAYTNLQAMRATRTWRLREWLLRFAPLRALLVRRSAAR